MAQRTRPLNQQVQLDQAITSQSSLFQVKTLVHAGIGCIAFLRGLFDEDSFEDAKLEAPRPVDTTTPLRGGKDKEKLEKPSTVRIKKLKKGGCESADKLIDWLELGVSDGIEKGYLHRLIFAIYLDPEDPTNLVESYTFTFTYETDDQGNRRADMEVHDQMKGMLLSSTSKLREEIHKEGEVKRQVQQVIKNLLTSTQLLDELPRRRFFTLRALWYDETPDDYQPYGFKKLTRFWPDYNLTTPSINDTPETSSLGAIQTGYHGVSIHTVTISHILETSFDDTITKAEATERNQREAAARPVVWDAQTLVESVTDAEDAMKIPRAVGIKDDQGQVVDIDTVIKDKEFADLRKKTGIEEDPEKQVWAKGLAEEEALIDSNLSDNENLRRAVAATSKLPPTEEDSVTQEDPVVNRQHSHKSPVPEFSETAEEVARRLAQSDNSFEGPAHAQARSQGGAVAGNSLEDVEMVETWTAGQKGKGVARRDDHFASPPVIESQLLEFSQHPQAESHDTIMNESSKKLETLEEPDTIQTDTQPEPQALAVQHREPKVAPREEATTAKRKASRSATEDEACECGDSTDIGVMVCCTSCESWRHNACYGYPESMDDVPEIFICYRCRAHSAAEDALLDDSREGDIENALANLKSLALFRRAIALIWIDSDGVVDSRKLAKTLKIDKATAAQMLKRLHKEKFIISQPTLSKSRSKKPESVVNKSTEHMKKKKLEYFSPGEGAEKPILAMLDNNDGDVAHTEGEEEGYLQQTTQNATTSGATPRVLVPDTPSPATVAASPVQASASHSNRFDRNKTLQTLEEELEDDYDGSSALSDLSDLEDHAQGNSDPLAQKSSNKFEMKSTPRDGPSSSQNIAPTAPQKPRMGAEKSSASPSVSFSNLVRNDSVIAQASTEEQMQIDPVDQDLATPRAQTLNASADRPPTPNPRITATAPSTSNVSNHPLAASLPLIPSKRPASPDEEDEEAGFVATQGGEEGGTEWRKVKKQKVSESEENLEAE